MKWHPYGNIDPFNIPDAADRLLNEYFNIAERLKIDTFLLYGTCLGFVRDGGYIPGDNDIDVGVLDGFSLLSDELVKNSFWPVVTVRENSHFLKYGILLDIYFKFPSLKYLDPFDKVVYKTRAYNVPQPIDEYLKSSYGDWRTVKHDKS